MTQYIDKSALVAEIERRIKEHHSGYLVCLKEILSFINTLEVKEIQEDDSIWHDITEVPQYNQNGITDLIVDSYYGHIGREAHYYNSEQWSTHLGFMGQNIKCGNLPKKCTNYKKRCTSITQTLLTRIENMR